MKTKLILFLFSVLLLQVNKWLARYIQIDFEMGSKAAATNDRLFPALVNNNNNQRTLCNFSWNPFQPKFSYVAQVRSFVHSFTRPIFCTIYNYVSILKSILYSNSVLYEKNILFFRKGKQIGKTTIKSILFVPSVRAIYNYTEWGGCECCPLTTDMKAM